MLRAPRRSWVSACLSPLRRRSAAVSVSAESIMLLHIDRMRFLSGLVAECFLQPNEGRSAAWEACRCIGMGFCDEGSVLPKESTVTARTPRDHLLCHARRARETAALLTELLIAERLRRGTGIGAPAASARDQAMLVLRWFRED